MSHIITTPVETVFALASVLGASAAPFDANWQAAGPTPLGPNIKQLDSTYFLLKAGHTYLLKATIQATSTAQDIATAWVDNTDTPIGTLVEPSLGGGSTLDNFVVQLVTPVSDLQVKLRVLSGSSTSTINAGTSAEIRQLI